MLGLEVTATLSLSKVREPQFDDTLQQAEKKSSNLNNMLAIEKGKTRGSEVNFKREDIFRYPPVGIANEQRR